MTTYERSQILLKTAAIVADNLDDFAVTIAREGSKTINEARGRRALRQHPDHLR